MGFVGVHADSFLHSVASPFHSFVPTKLATPPTTTMPGPLLRSSLYAAHTPQANSNLEHMYMYMSPSHALQILPDAACVESLLP